MLLAQLSLSFLSDPAFMLFSCIALCTCVPVMASAWQKVKESEHRAALKRDLAERGMSAAEICSVLEAGEKGKKA